MAKPQTKQYLGMPIGNDHFRGINHRYSYSKEDIEEGYAYFREVFKKSERNQIITNILDTWKKYCKELESFTQEVIQKNENTLSLEELTEIFKQIKEKYTKASTAIFIPILIEKVIEEYLEEKLKKEENKEEYFQILTSPEKESTNSKEKKNLLKIAIAKEKGEDISLLLDKHTQKFGWLNYRAQCITWNNQDFLARIEQINNPSQELIRLKEQEEETKQKTKEVLEKVAVDKELIALTKELVFFRTERMDIYLKCFCQLSKFFFELEKRKDLAHKESMCLTIKEIIRFSQEGYNYKETITKRKQEYGFISNEEIITVLTGTTLQSYKENYAKEKKYEKITQFTGTVACKGSVIGNVKIIYQASQLHKVQSGDILVTSMTTPDYVPAMEKAIGFITNEGGILCHAAIVSREMNKPCIIGTKIATKVLKDGDRVEVDAQKGIVKILK